MQQLEVVGVAGATAGAAHCCSAHILVALQHAQPHYNAGVVLWRRHAAAAAASYAQNQLIAHLAAHHAPLGLLRPLLRLIHPLPALTQV